MVTRHVADVLPPTTGHHLTGGHHADRGGGDRAGVQADHGDGDAGTELRVQNNESRNLLYCQRERLFALPGVDQLSC